jgi:type II secretory pathway component PulK
MRLRSNRRGSISIFLVLLVSLVMSAFVLSGGARITPFVAETRRQRASDQARVLAESGVLAARQALSRDPQLTELDDLVLAGGRVVVRIERGEDGDLRVESTGVAPDGAAGPGASATRRVRVQLRPLAEGGHMVVAWEEL